MKVSRNWLQTYFDEPIPSGKELEELYMFHSFEVEGVEEHDGDVVLDIDVLANRSSDCLCHRGMARELATLIDRPLKRDPLRDPIPVRDEPSGLAISVEDAKLCPRYMGAVVRGVAVGPSPEWLRKALESVGQKSINNIVDATNYVMWNVGQPLHAFDLAKLELDSEHMRRIVVRPAKDGERIVTLSGEEYALAERHLIIADGVSGDALAIAGVKGGKKAEISPETVDLVLEAANFDYASVRKTSRELKLATDASLRFQNEPGRELPAFAMNELIALINEVAGGECQGVADVYTGPRERTPISVTRREVNALLGTALTGEDIERILVRFEWEFSRSGETYTVTPAWERSDLTSKESLVEELGRVYGYRKIAGVLPQRPAHSPRVHKAQYVGDKIRRFLADRGYSEVLTYTLRQRGAVELANPLASDKAMLRLDLREGMIDALERNATQVQRLGMDDVKLFEVGTVWNERGEDIALALGVRGVRTKQSALEKTLADDIGVLRSMFGTGLEGASADGIFETLLDSAITLYNEPDAYDEPLPWDPTVRYKPWSQYPYMLRDIAVWVPSGTPAEEVSAVIVERAPDLLTRHDLFDSFEKGGRISYAWHLVFESFDRTLTDAEINPIMDSITKAFGEKGWEVR